MKKLILIVIYCGIAVVTGLFLTVVTHKESVTQSAIQEGVQAAQGGIAVWKSWGLWNDPNANFSSQTINEYAEIALNTVNDLLLLEKKKPFSVEQEAAFKAAYIAYLRDARDRDMPRYRVR
jgi:hypothetical protein